MTDPADDAADGPHGPDGPDALDGPVRDEPDPYEGDDLSTYPDWWRENVEQFRASDLPPYRPPRFADGTHSQPLIEDLEASLGVDIRFQVVDPQAGGQWTLLVDGEPVAPVEHQRVREGYSEYGITAAEFEELVREAVDGDRS